MAIRNAAKAILFRDNKILVNRCMVEETGEIYYDFPGGGQHQFETMEEAVAREVLEETGYRVEALRFVALAEEIYDSETLRKQYFDYSHRVIHVFLTRLLEALPTLPTEIDFQQQESIWVPLEEAEALHFRPDLFRGKLGELIFGEHPQFLGSVHV